MKDISLWLITNKPDIAKFAIQNGVDRIFVDLELLGKIERQGHLSTVISYHTLEDVEKVRKAIPSGKLLVRTNPIHEKIKDEIDKIIYAGADILMLPMWRTIKEVELFIDYVQGRTRIMLLAETPESLKLLPLLCHYEEIDEFHIGLNDLHLALHKKFMFELIADGTIEQATHCLRQNYNVFGIGGIARLGEGLIPAEIVLSEHVRMGSTAAILSRTFHRNAPDLKTLNSEMNFDKEVSNIKVLYKKYQTQDPSILEKNHNILKNIVESVVKIHGN